MTDTVIRDALERWEHSLSGSSHNREMAIEDIRFARLAEQWPDGIRSTRRQEGRPCLTINRLPSFIRQVVNDSRQNKPGILVAPVDNGADYDTAQVVQGLIRSIERRSSAGVAYDTAIEQAVTGGFGFFRISVDYCHPESFDMEARIDRIGNPLSVYWDVRSQAFDASDWEYAFVINDMTQREFKKAHPKAKSASWEDGRGDRPLGEWIGEDLVRLAEYWLRVEKKRKLLQLSDGTVIRAEQLDEPVELEPGLLIAPQDALAMAGVTVQRERDATYFEVKRRLISAVETLEETDWPGTTIPICPVYGEELIFDGRRYLRSLVRDARDPQAMLNFWRSASTELVALAPRAPWLMPQGALPTDGPERLKWLTANTKSHAYLTFNGQMVPQRNAFAGVPAGALQEALNASDDIKAVIGIYDASLGARSNETSGRAILARQRESDVATFHFIDNLARAIEYAGRVLVEIIPSLYSQRQAIQILGEDETQKIVRLSVGAGQASMGGDGEERLYDLSVGRYDVAVKVGPSYATQREAAREGLTEIIAQNPAAAIVLGDLVLKTMDFPEADEAAKRVKLLQAVELAKMGLPADVDQAMKLVESGQWPPQPMMPPGLPGMPPGDPGMPQPMPGELPPPNGGF